MGSAFDVSRTLHDELLQNFHDAVRAGSQVRAPPWGVASRAFAPRASTTSPRSWASSAWATHTWAEAREQGSYQARGAHLLVALCSPRAQATTW